MSDGSKLLIVDDDSKLRALLKKFLLENNFLVTDADCAKEATGLLLVNAYDLIILDVMMPGESGMQLAQSIRQKIQCNSNTPILMLTALSEVDDRINGLQSGADDYLSKPFDPRELLLRIEKILSRTKNIRKVNNVLKLGNLEYNINNRSLYNNKGDTVYLTSAESDLLYMLSQHIQQPVSRFDFADRIGVSLSPRAVDVQITRLRKKIELDPKKPQYLRTIRHKGYALWSD